jgi:putative flippase GtrA
VLAQALAIAIVTMVNFSVHRFWTYSAQRHGSPVEAPSAAISH